MAKYVVLTGPVDADVSQSITTMIRDYGVGWWHHLPNSWLVSDGTGKVDSAKIRDDLGALVPGLHCMVLEVKPDTWHGFGPNSEDPEKKNRHF